jgi:hypothetical protein
MTRNNRRAYFIDFLSNLPAPVATELIRKLTPGRRVVNPSKTKDFYRKHRSLQKRA